MGIMVGGYLGALVSATGPQKLTAEEIYKRQRERHRRQLEQDQKIIRRRSAMVLTLIWLGVCIWLV